MPLNLRQLYDVVRPGTYGAIERATEIYFNGEFPGEVKPKMMKPWTLEDGLGLVRALQEDSRQYGYHLALGGGVLNKGRSDKDLDLYFLPLDNQRMNKPDPTALEAWLTKLWGLPDDIGVNYPDEQAVYSLDVETPTRLESKPSIRSVYKRKLKFVRKDGDRIDVFIM